MLMDQSSRDDTLVDVEPPGATLAGAVSRQSSRDKRPKRSARGSSMRGEGKAISDVAQHEGVRVRPAEPADAAVLVALAEAVGSEPEGWLISDRRWRSVGDERRYLRAARRHPDAAVFVAETETGIAGRLSISRDPHPASRHVVDVGLMVAAPQRRRGVGKALLEQAVAWAREAGVRKIELHVFPHNQPAIRLYERFGFVREGYRKQHYRRGDRYVDAILMAYEVDPPTRG